MAGSFLTSPQSPAQRSQLVLRHLRVTLPRELLDRLTLRCGYQANRRMPCARHASARRHPPSRLLVFFSEPCALPVCHQSHDDLFSTTFTSSSLAFGSCHKDV